MKHTTLKRYPRLRLLIFDTETKIRNIVHRWYPKLVKGRCPECGEFLHEALSTDWYCCNCNGHSFDFDEGGYCLNGCETNGYEHLAD